MRRQPTLWCDMDGVIAVYEPHAYIGPKPLFLRPEQHYFATVQPNPSMIHALKDLTEHAVSVRLISNILFSPVAGEQKADKQKWADRYLPFLSRTPILFLHEEKYKGVLRETGALYKTDLLVSDYNKDLVPWNRAGGTGVKYLNGINSPNSYTGPQIPPDADVNAICDVLYQLWRDISAKQNENGGSFHEHNLL